MPCFNKSTFVKMLLQELLLLLKQYGKCFKQKFPPVKAGTFYNADNKF